MSDRATLLRGIPIGTSLSPVGVTLPPTIPATAAAVLLPPQSAAMAAYLNAAAAAAVAQHSHRMMMTSPLPPSFNRASISPLITSSLSPPSGFHHSPIEQPLPSPNSEAILDFSKRGQKSDAGDSDSDVVNLSKPDSPISGDTGAPLDLSVTNRKRSADETPSHTAHRKQRTEYKPTPAIPAWPPGIGASHLPYFAAAVAAAGLSPKGTPSELWNGKLKQATPTPSDATKALEKMSELSKLGGDDLFRTMAVNSAPSNSANNRHSAWQSHWLNKGAEQAKDVLKCVWCKQSFPSLAAMTTHMKEAKHCGVNVPVPTMQAGGLIPQPQISSPPNTNTSCSSTNSSKPQTDLNMLIKETMPLPRKLVRGQDVWLGKGAEQTRQILKCMWCGQSFRSLAEMTSHMQQTQHYTNIISQEQIISWRSSDDGKVGSSAGGPPGPNPPPGGTSSHVSAVLTCKVCDQAFSSLKELSNHMVKNSHYKEHIMRSITESGGRRRQTREKRKKSLPVRKLLELERAQHEFKNGDSASLLEKMRDAASAGRITCEKCGNKIETTLFVDHIRQCVGGITSNQKNFLKSALMSTNILLPESPTREKIKTPTEKSQSPQQRPSSVSDLSTKESPATSESNNNNGSSPSVLNAIEKLIEKSFDSRSRQNPAFPGHSASQAPMGSSILKRLGIDESVDYTKPLVDAQTMNLLRNYHQQQNQHYGRRERSGSESSTMSERGSSRVESLTPERKMDPPGVPITSTPRSTPDIKREKSPFIDKLNNASDTDSEKIIVKKELEEEDRSSNEIPKDLKVKRELENEEDEHTSFHTNGDAIKHGEENHSPIKSPPHLETTQPTSPCRNSTSSPASSDRSGTPRSTNGDRKQVGGGSLGALSSMFDSLSGTTNSSSEVNQGSGKKGSSHPLAALQKLCDKTETHTNNRTHAASAVMNPLTANTTTTASGTTPGAILAFSWACNDAVMTSDSIMKCAFCDTPFISKGAYRHHLSKMHFVKDGVIPDPVTLKAPQPSSSSTNSGVPLKSTNIIPNVQTGSGTQGSKSPPTSGGSFEESPHSKFLKYTELAKQLSSKYV